MSAKQSYWQECIESAFDEHGVTASPEQINAIASDIEDAHECYGMAFYQPENPLIGELKEAKQALKTEQEKVYCRACNGTGRIYTQGPHHGCDSQCWKCGGYGKHKP